LVCLCTFFVPSQEKCKDDNVCIQMKTHGMWSADCYKLDFKRFPQCLRSDVEVIDLSYNRLRDITRKELSRYTNLKLLYLSDNLLTNLENSTFEDMDDLISLDLSLNGISKLPEVIFHLPSLKRLYLSHNQNMNIIEVVDETKPITSPLEAIDISFNKLEVLPDFGVMPHLMLYNISGNNLMNMEMKDISGLCNLQQLANDNFTTFFGNPCDCWNIQRWLRERGVKFTKIECEIEAQECPYNISQEDMVMFNTCKVRFSEIKRQSTVLKIGLIVSAIVFVLITILFCILYRRRKQRKSKIKKAKAGSFAINGKKENEGLL